MANDFGNDETPTKIVAVTEAEQLKAYSLIVTARSGTLFDQSVAEASGIEIINAVDIYPDPESELIQLTFSEALSANRGLLVRNGQRGMPARLDQAVQGVNYVIGRCVSALRLGQHAESDGHILSGRIGVTAITLPSQGYRLYVNKEDGKLALIRDPGRLGILIGRHNELLDGYEHAVVAVITNGYTYTDSDGDEVRHNPTIDIASLSSVDKMHFGEGPLHRSELEAIVREGSWLSYTSSTGERDKRFYPSGRPIYLTGAIHTNLR